MSWRSTVTFAWCANIVSKLSGNTVMLGGVEKAGSAVESRFGNCGARASLPGTT